MQRKSKKCKENYEKTNSNQEILEFLKFKFFEKSFLLVYCMKFPYGANLRDETYLNLFYTFLRFFQCSRTLCVLIFMAKLLGNTKN
jgi:hypothetical protein